MLRANLQHHLPDFSLQVDFESKGPVLGIFGPSGSGKSTLLNLLSGWTLPNGTGQAARIEAAGSELHGCPPERRGLGVVPQDSLLLPHKSVAANLAFSPGGAGRLAHSHGQQVVDWLRLGPLLDRRSDTLSGGERQRVALGRAWLSEPRMVLLDEPAASLDPELAREVIALLAEAKQTWGIPMVFVTHRPSELLALADDCLQMEAGRIRAQGPPPPDPGRWECRGRR